MAKLRRFLTAALLAGVLALFAGEAHAAAVSLVGFQTSSLGGPSATGTLTLSAAPTAGNMLVVLICRMDQSGVTTLTGVSGSVNSAYTAYPGATASRAATNFSNLHADVYYKANVAGVVETITASWTSTGANPYWFVSVYELGGAGIDQAVGNSGSSSAPSAGSITLPASDGAISLAFTVQDATPGTTLAEGQVYWAIENSYFPSASPYADEATETPRTSGSVTGNFTSTTSGPWVAVLVDFIPPLPSSYYVDPDYNGGTRNGSQANPWKSLSDSGGGVTDPWTSINAALASAGATVYFSARAAGSDSDQATTVAVNLDRTDTSTNVLTLDGKSQYNSNDATPSWSAYAGSSRFKVTADYPMSADNSGSPYTKRNYITAQGFKLIATNGQIASLTGMDHLIFQDNDLSATGSPIVGPGLIVGESNLSAHNWNNHVQILNNTVHNTFGECIYIGATSANPPGPGGSGYSTTNNVSVTGGTGSGLKLNIVTGEAPSQAGEISTVAIGTAGTSYTVGDIINISGGGSNAQMQVVTIGGGGAVTLLGGRPANLDVLVKGNTIYNCATLGGQGDGIDVKDGNQASVVNNTIYHSGYAANCNTCRAIVADSAVAISRNFIHDWTGTNVVTGIETVGGWRNTNYRTGATIDDNIVVNVAGDGIKLDGPDNASYKWSGTKIYYNTVVSSGGSNYTVPNSADYHDGIILKDNISVNGATNGFDSPAGRLGAHDYNAWYQGGGGTLTHEGSTNYTAATLATWEAHSISSDPKLVKASSTSAAANFNIFSSSPAKTAGDGNCFNFDFNNYDRSVFSCANIWPLGAFAYTVAAGSGRMLLLGAGQ